MPPLRSGTLPCVSPYISATLYMTQFIRRSQTTLRSPVRRCKNNHPCFRLMLISLPSGEATWDKAQATLDTSNQWNPQGLRWVYNEVHCSQLESPSPRNGLTFRLLFVFVLLFGSLQLVNTSTKPPIRRSICLCGQRDSSFLLHHEAKINNLSSVRAHPPTVTPFTLFSALQHYVFVQRQQQLIRQYNKLCRLYDQIWLVLLILVHWIIKLNILNRFQAKTRNIND